MILALPEIFVCHTRQITGDEYVHSIDVSSLRRIMQQYPRALGEIQMKSLVQSRGVTSYAVDVVRRFYNKN